MGPMAPFSVLNSPVRGEMVKNRISNILIISIN